MARVLEITAELKVPLYDEYVHTHIHICWIIKDSPEFSIFLHTLQGGYSLLTVLLQLRTFSGSLAVGLDKASSFDVFL